MGFSFNEISAKSNGGTEQVSRQLEAKLGSLIDDFQIIPSRVRELDPHKYRVLHVHDCAPDPMFDNVDFNQFHRIVFCGQTQRTNFQNIRGIPADIRSTVIDTPIDPIPYIDKPTDRINLIYTSTPQRGLSILLPVFDALSDEFPNIHLDVFSSFKIYGFDDADKQFEPLYEYARSHPQITNWGYQDNSVVRKHLQKAHIFATPNTWYECNSRSLIEAMSAGCICVHSDYGGMPDTAAGMTEQYSYDSDPNRHAQIFYNVLRQTILDVQESIARNNGEYYEISKLHLMRKYANARFDIDRIVKNWIGVLESTRQMYGPLPPKPNEMVEFRL